jgi:hypothetical protein
MSLYPVTTTGQPRADAVRKLPPPLALTQATPNCTRDGLHIDKVATPDTLASLWPWIREGLLYIKHKNGERMHWLPEHVRMEILKGYAGQSMCECFVGHDAEHNTLRGFLIAYPLVDPFVNLALSWHVWMSTMNDHTLNDVLAEFEGMARARGYLRYQWGSSRKGWERRATRFGCRVVERIIAKEL